RRRGLGQVGVVLWLGRRGVIQRVDLDTTHFKGNFPESASLDGCDAADASGPPGKDADWEELVARTELRAHARHRLVVTSATRGPVTHVRLNIFPDGGVARLRVWGSRWVDAMLAAGRVGHDAELLASAERVWWRLGRVDWLEAFAHHARIGEGAGDAWSRREQAGMDGAGEDTRRALAQGNRDYEKR